MKTVSISHLRSHLKEILEEIKKGKNYKISQHGHIIAEIIPSNEPEKEKDLAQKIREIRSNCVIEGDIINPIFEGDILSDENNLS